MNEQYLRLTELWQDGYYNEVSSSIRDSNWKPSELVKFCSYFSRYLGSKELDVLSKLI